YVDQGLAAAVSITGRPDTLAVGSPVEAAHSCPFWNRNHLLRTLSQRQDPNRRHFLHPLPLGHRQHRAVRRETPVEVVSTDGLNLGLRNLHPSAFIRIEVEEPFVAGLKSAEHAYHGRQLGALLIADAGSLRNQLRGSARQWGAHQTRGCIDRGSR